MKRFVVLDKKVGETPLEAIRIWKKQNPKYADVPASYAGRLDPMASGKLLVLIGDECKNQKKYTDLDKEYEIEVLLDIASDTGDVLGIPEYSNQITTPKRRTIVNVLKDELGSHVRKYPVFSSKTINGKPLFLYALEKKLEDIIVPEHIENIFNIKLLNLYTVSGEELTDRVSLLLDYVPRTNEPSKRLGEDFRVDVIRAHWEELFKTLRDRKFIVLRLKITCGSGTYMRSLAGRIGISLNTKAFAFSINRTKIGKYLPLWNGAGFWFSAY